MSSLRYKSASEEGEHLRLGFLPPPEVTERIAQEPLHLERAFTFCGETLPRLCVRPADARRFPVATG